MSFSSLLRPFGLCSFIGGLLIALVQPWLYVDPESFIATYLNYIGYLLIAFGMIGLCLVQYKSMGVFSFFSFTILFFGMIMWLGVKWFQTFVVADILISAPEVMDSGLQATLFGMNLSLYSLLIGMILFAVISLWKGIVSPFGSSLLLIGSITEIFRPFVGTGSYESIIAPIIIGLAFSSLGYSLFLKQYQDQDMFEDLSENKTADIRDANQEQGISRSQVQAEMSSSV
ncbi:hypothetical protein JMM81_08575 [Bacillus sp. V3B]|uniref:hypothetical protein n=1 Tax=Bacillus sp. V3B TaxID=2804915 RepID=UPI00210E3494|nr:hypothetical protein [Bacillus sp. V3B]MCQ6275014.1 hypothetical protein [Bacillus sp. V3B]